MAVEILLLFAAKKQKIGNVQRETAPKNEH
jgi:hypothetical protein